METEHGGTEPEKTAEYLEPEYWNRRFRTEETYDWLKGYAEFRHLIRPHLSTGDKILVVGCGNSSLTQDLWRDGFQDVTSIDLSEVLFCLISTQRRASPAVVTVYTLSAEAFFCINSRLAAIYGVCFHL